MVFGLWRILTSVPGGARTLVSRHGAPSPRYFVARNRTPSIVDGLFLARPTSQSVHGTCRRYTHPRGANVYSDLMRTNIVIDDQLLAEAQRLSGAPTKRQRSSSRCRSSYVVVHGERCSISRGESSGKATSVSRGFRVIVVDTSVWVDFFRDQSTPKVEKFVALVEDDAGIAITDVILTEILQGLRSERDVRRVERRWSSSKSCVSTTSTTSGARRRCIEARGARASRSAEHSTV